MNIIKYIGETYKEALWYHTLSWEFSGISMSILSILLMLIVGFGIGFTMTAASSSLASLCILTLGLGFNFVLVLCIVPTLLFLLKFGFRWKDNEKCKAMSLSLMRYLPLHDTALWDETLEYDLITESYKVQVSLPKRTVYRLEFLTKNQKIDLGPFVDQAVEAAWYNAEIKPSIEKESA